MLKHVIKRDGSVQPFDMSKIAEAIYKTDMVSIHEAETIAEEALTRFENIGASVTIEEIQDAVEDALMMLEYVDTAKHYILYREERRRLRTIRMAPPKGAIADYIHAAKYARYLEGELRRETWEETVNRREDMDLRRWPELAEEISKAFSLVVQKKVLPSMRSMQFGGAAIEQLNARLFNCSFSLVDRVEFFHHMFYLLLAGCGVGFSVQYQHVEKLPVVEAEIDRTNVFIHKIDDSIKGWAEALRILIESYMNDGTGSPFTGCYVEFDYSDIRLQGKKLKTSGGVAPGHVPLKLTLEKVRETLEKARGRQLKPIECHDMNCHIADGVLAGGIRRSSLISLFSPDDAEMMQAKTGSWMEENSQRRLSNNSAVLVRGNHAVNKRAFKNIFEHVQQYGEPGFFFTANADYGCNPCGEIGLNPVDPVSGKTGFAFCNLTEVNAVGCKTAEEFIEAVKMAARIGTYQAAYTKFDYLGEPTCSIADREALLGVSITGIYDNPIAQDPGVLRAAANAAVAENSRVARQIGINPAARVTTIKPSGTASLALDCVGAGHGPHHARRYIRRIIANPHEPVFQYFKSINPHMCVPYSWKKGEFVIEFPVVAPDNAVVRAELSSREMIDGVFNTYQNWIVPGTANWLSSAGLTHNVSCTINVEADKWDDVRDYVWENRDKIAAMSFLAVSGDKDYVQAPREEIVTAADEARWQEILDNYTPVDYTQLHEQTDTTDPRAVSGCEGMICELPQRNTDA